MARISVHELKAMKRRGEKIAMLTAYDYPTAKLLDQADILRIGLPGAHLDEPAAHRPDLEGIAEHPRAVQFSIVP